MSLEQALQYKDKFLAADHNWSPQTKHIYRKSFNRYINSGFPDTTYRAMIVRCLNRLSKWCFEEGLTESHVPLKGGNKYGHRTRVFNDEELEAILNCITPIHFQEMVRLIYYTGARQCEVRNYDFEHFGHYMRAKSKGGDRLIRTNRQAQEVIARGHKWKYSACTASRAFRDNMKRLKMSGTLHDLRRTFGLRMIKKIGIYETSKLLGHASVETTEKHYAPLLAIDIDDFVL